jgi:hypothetical protein
VTISTAPHSAPTHTDRRPRFAAALVVSAPLLVLLSELVAPREPGGQSAADYARFLVDHSGRFTISWVLGMLAGAALATAYVVLSTRLTGRGRIVGRVAAALGVLGAVALAVHEGVMLAGLDLVLADAESGKALDIMDNGRLAVATIPPVVLGLNLAVVLISIAAVRAGWAPRWAIALGVAALIGDFSPTNFNTVIHACFATALFAVIVRGWAAEDR